MCLALFSRQFNLKALLGVIPHTGVTEPVSKALPRRVKSLVMETDGGRVERSRFRLNQGGICVYREDSLFTYE